MAWSLFGRRSAAIGVVATVVVACAAPSTAAAAVLLPDGEAPQDTALWALDVYRAEVKLFGPDGAELAIDAIEAPPVGEAVLGVDPTERFPGAAWRPAQPLVVGATYELRLLDPAQSTHFTVVAAPEPAPGPPAVPAVVRTKDYAENTKDQSPCVGHDAALQGHAYTRVEVSSAGAFTLAFVEGSSGVALQAAVQTDRPTAAFDVGMSSMETPGPDPMLSADGPTTLRFGSFDLAGRFSGWTEPYVVDPPEFPAGGCAVVTGGPGLGFVLLLALRFPRRRSARAARH